MEGGEVPHLALGLERGAVQLRGLAVDDCPQQRLALLDGGHVLAQQQSAQRRGRLGQPPQDRLVLLYLNSENDEQDFLGGHRATQEDLPEVVGDCAEGHAGELVLLDGDGLLEQREQVLLEVMEDRLAPRGQDARLCGLAQPHLDEGKRRALAFGGVRGQLGLWAQVIFDDREVEVLVHPRVLFLGVV